MIKTGFVIRADFNTADVRVHRESSCGGNCSHCKGCGVDEIIITVPNDINAVDGETVKIIMPDKKFLSGALLGYGILVLAMVLGGIIGYIISKNDVFSAVLSFLSLVIVLLLYRIIFKNRKDDVKIERI